MELQGIDSTIAALERFAPDLKKALDKEVKGVLSKVVTQAREYIPFDISIHHIRSARRSLCMQHRS